MTSGTHDTPRFRNNLYCFTTSLLQIELRKLGRVGGEGGGGVRVEVGWGVRVVG